jgi:hypothetical protein
MRFTSGYVAVALAAGALVAATPLHAKTCKDAVSAKSTSKAQMSDSAREQRARDRAIANWSKRARSTYGWSYRFWMRAEDKQVECGGTAKSKHCNVSAKPCSLM